MDWAANLKAAKERMREACVRVALANTPESLRCIRVRRTLSGRAYSPEWISVPRPFTRRALHIFLHECAHVVLGHVGPKTGRKPRHVEEYEAERWAFDRMREAGISVPRKSLERAKRYVAYKIRQAKARGAKGISRDALRWSTGSGM